MKDWRYFNKYEAIIDKYMPERGEGETMASQAVTAVNKLIYKWYNDGDVFDNTHVLDGWMNDLSSYANWLALNVEGAGDILDDIAICYTGDDYEDLLAALADWVLDEEMLAPLADCPKSDSIYDCEGVYRYEEPSEDDEDDENW